MWTSTTSSSQACRTHHSALCFSGKHLQRVRQSTSLLAFAVLTTLLLVLSFPAGPAAAHPRLPANRVHFQHYTGRAADATCTPVASPSADVKDPNAKFDTAANVIASFTTARQQEGCNVPLSLPATYDTDSPSSKRWT